MWKNVLLFCVVIFQACFYNSAYAETGSVNVNGGTVSVAKEGFATHILYKGNIVKTFDFVIVSNIEVVCRGKKSDLILVKLDSIEGSSGAPTPTDLAYFYFNTNGDGEFIELCEKYFEISNTRKEIIWQCDEMRNGKSNRYIIKLKDNALYRNNKMLKKVE